MEKRILLSLLSLALGSFIVEVIARHKELGIMTAEEERIRALEEVNRILEPTAVVYARIQQQFVETIARTWTNEAYKGETFTPRKLSELQGSDNGKGA